MINTDRTDEIIFPDMSEIDFIYGPDGKVIWTFNSIPEAFLSGNVNGSKGETISLTAGVTDEDDDFRLTAYSLTQTSNSVSTIIYEDTGTDLTLPSTFSVTLGIDSDFDDVFTLMVTDDKGFSNGATHTVDVLPNSTPTFIRLTASQNVGAGSSLTITADQFSDPDGDPAVRYVFRRSGTSVQDSTSNTY